jgi:hypothetical protein
MLNANTKFFFNVAKNSVNVLEKLSIMRSKSVN